MAPVGRTPLLAGALYVKEELAVKSKEALALINEYMDWRHANYKHGEKAPTFPEWRDLREQTQKQP